MPETLYDVLILGGGPSGLTAAVYASRAQLKTLIVGGAPSGGQLTTTTDVENYPGFPEGIQGPQLIEDMRKQATRFGAEHVESNVTEISGSFNDRFTIKTDANTEYKGKTVIIATGASARWLPLESVERLKNKGVSACATCDGFFFKDKVTAVVGGGDAAMEEANFMTKFSPKVYLIVRGDPETMKASKIMQKRAQDNKKIEFLYNTEIKEVLGENAVSGLVITNNKTNEESKLEDVEGLFMAIGHKPNTSFLEGFIELGKMGYIDPVDNTKTSVEGVFVSGDVGDFRYRQAITAAGFGCMAALDAERFLSEHGDHEMTSVY
ncbi:thioredoxin-disulfide reductase [candidate division WWE3 bacterium]|jgi:thioredoxin reductase (NADPH)|nr:thioredoxin-disulfide reductase [candidate division WWE3 bacterium]MBT7349277.1 thioredoxin-disulfide reductase [candidate division WWE3 bacterium]